MDVNDRPYFLKPHAVYSGSTTAAQPDPAAQARQLLQMNIGGPGTVIAINLPSALWLTRRIE